MTTNTMTVDGRKNGLSTKGFPLRKIVSREGGVHVLSCGHSRARSNPDSPYDLCKSRRCPECGGVKPELTVEAALKELREMFPDTFLSVKHHAIHHPTWEPATTIQVDIQLDDKFFRCGTLVDCMAQVRAWRSNND